MPYSIIDYVHADKCTDAHAHLSCSGPLQGKLDFHTIPTQELTDAHPSARAERCHLQVEAAGGS